MLLVIIWHYSLLQIGALDLALTPGMTQFMKIGKFFFACGTQDLKQRFQNSSEILVPAHRPSPIPS